VVLAEEKKRIASHCLATAVWLVLLLALLLLSVSLSVSLSARVWWKVKSWSVEHASFLGGFSDCIRAERPGKVVGLVCGRLMVARWVAERLGFVTTLRCPLGIAAYSSRHCRSSLLASFLRRSCISKLHSTSGRVNGGRSGCVRARPVRV